MTNEAFLHLGKFAHILRGRRPAGMWIALPGADAAAWSIHEHAIKTGLGGQVFAAVPYAGPAIKNPSACSPPFELVEPPGRAVGCPDQAFVSHQSGEVQQLAAFTGARVPPG